MCIFGNFSISREKESDYKFLVKLQYRYKMHMVLSVLIYVV